MDSYVFPDTYAHQRTAPLETPSERRRRQVRESIIDAAEKVFDEEGMDGLSIRRIADEIQYSPGAIYKYFASKDELVDCLKEAFFKRLIRNLDQEIGKEWPSFRDMVWNCMQTYIRVALEKPHHYSSAFQGFDQIGLEPLKADEAEELFQVTSRGQAYLMLKSLVTEGQENGTFRTDFSAHLGAKSLWASMHGLAVLMIHFPAFPNTFPNEEDIERSEFIAFHVRQIIRGIENSEKK